MRDISTLQAVVNQLKREKGITIKKIADEIAISYTYLSRQLSGNMKYSDATYDSIMNYARKQGIHTPMAQGPSIVSDVSQPYQTKINAGNFEIVLRVRLTNNEISGVVWDKVPV